MDTDRVTLTFKDHRLLRQDFVGLNSDALVCDVTARITRGVGGFTVRIVSVYSIVYQLELGSFLKRDAEERLEAWVLSYFLNDARSGLEGDCPEASA